MNLSQHPLVDLGLKGDLPSTWLAIVALLFIAGLCYASYTDLFRGRIVPDWASLPWLIGGLIALPLYAAQPLTHYILVAVIVVVAVPLALYGLMGLGDVKLYAAVVVLMGLAGVGAVMAAHVVAACVMLPIMAVKGRDATRHVPMGPMLVAGIAGVLAIGGHTVIAVAALGGLGVAIAAGLLERRLLGRREPAELLAFALAADADQVRITEHEAPEIHTAAGWQTLPQFGRFGIHQIDRVFYSALNAEDDKALTEQTALRAQATIGGRRQELQIERQTHVFTVAFGATPPAPQVALSRGEQPQDWLGGDGGAFVPALHQPVTPSRSVPPLISAAVTVAVTAFVCSALWDRLRRP